MAIQLERVLISDSIDVSCRDILTEGGINVDYRPGLTKDELLTCVKVYIHLYNHVCVCRSRDVI